MSPHNYVYFGICGDFDPEALVSKIGIEPTSSQTKHSRDPERKIPRNSLLRFAQTHAEDNDPVVDVYKLAETVYQALKDHTKRIAEVIEAHEAHATFQVVLEFPMSDDVSTPAIGFSAEVIRFVSVVGASIDIDTYRA